MKKKDLLKLLDMANRIEEDAVAHLSQHLYAATEWCSASKVDVTRIREILTHLEKQSKSHIKILDVIKTRVTKENKDVY